MRKYVKNGFNCAYTADAIRFVCVLIWDALAMLLAGAFPGVTWHGFRHTLEQAVSPASYPTSPTRRWMRLVADARTGQWPMPTVTRIVVIQG